MREKIAVLIPISSPLNVHERTAGIPGIDSGIGLDEVLVISNPDIRPSDRADYAHSDRIAEAVRTAYCKDKFADLQCFGIPPLQCGKIGCIDLQYCNIRFRISPYNIPPERPPVRQRNLYLIRLFNHMVVCNDIAVRRNNNTGTEAAFFPFFGQAEVMKRTRKDRRTGLQNRLPVLSLTTLVVDIFTTAGETAPTISEKARLVSKIWRGTFGVPEYG